MLWQMRRCFGGLDYTHPDKTESASCQSHINDEIESFFVL